MNSKAALQTDKNWNLAVAECRKRKQDELDGNLTQTIHIAMGEILDRIQNGDSVVGKTDP